MQQEEGERRQRQRPVQDKHHAGEAHAEHAARAQSVHAQQAAREQQPPKHAARDHAVATAEALECCRLASFNQYFLCR